MTITCSVTETCYVKIPFVGEFMLDFHGKVDQEMGDSVILDNQDNHFLKP